MALNCNSTIIEKIHELALSKSIKKSEKDMLIEIVVLYNNAKFYFASGENVGALVSYSCAAVLLNTYKKNNNTDSNIDTVLNCCLNVIQNLQGKVQSSSSSENKDKAKDWEKICTKINPLIFSKGSNDCIFYSDVIGLEKEKKMINATLVFPLIYPNLYPSTSKGILIYGPPGTGKTYLIKAAVNELQKKSPSVGVLFFAPSPGELKGKYVGETEKKIEELFNCASRAACEAQDKCKNNGEDKKYISVIFMDEMDAIAPNRDRDPTGMAVNSVNTLLQMMDGIASFDNVCVVGATNYPWNLDDAIIRRFDTQIFIDVPTENDLLKLFKLKVNSYLSLYKKKKSKVCDKFLLKNIDTKKGTDDICTSTCVENPPNENHEKNEVYERFIIDFYTEYNSANNGIIGSIVKKFKYDNFSNSDLNRFFKAAVTKAGEMAVKNNLFYSAKYAGIELPSGEENIYISALTICKPLERSDFNDQIIRAIKQLHLIINNEKATDIIQLNPPKLIYILGENGYIYINTKCLFFQSKIITQFFGDNITDFEDIFIKYMKKGEFLNFKNMLSNKLDNLLSDKAKFVENSIFINYMKNILLLDAGLIDEFKWISSNKYVTKMINETTTCGKWEMEYITSHPIIIKFEEDVNNTFIKKIHATDNNLLKIVKSICNMTELQCIKSSDLISLISTNDSNTNDYFAVIPKNLNLVTHDILDFDVTLNNSFEFIVKLIYNDNWSGKVKKTDNGDIPDDVTNSSILREKFPYKYDSIYIYMEIEVYKRLIKIEDGSIDNGYFQIDKEIFNMLFGSKMTDIQKRATFNTIDINIKLKTIIYRTVVNNNYNISSIFDLNIFDIINALDTENLVSVMFLCINHDFNTIYSETETEKATNKIYADIQTPKDILDKEVENYSFDTCDILNYMYKLDRSGVNNFFENIIKEEYTGPIYNILNITNTYQLSPPQEVTNLILAYINMMKEYNSLITQTELNKTVLLGLFNKLKKITAQYKNELFKIEQFINTNKPNDVKNAIKTKMENNIKYLLDKVNQFTGNFNDVPLPKTWRKFIYNKIKEFTSRAGGGKSNKNNNKKNKKNKTKKIYKSFSSKKSVGGSGEEDCENLILKFKQHIAKYTENENVTDISTISQTIFMSSKISIGEISLYNTANNNFLKFIYNNPNFFNNILETAAAGAGIWGISSLVTYFTAAAVTVPLVASSATVAATVATVAPVVTPVVAPVVAVSLAASIGASISTGLAAIMAVFAIPITAAGGLALGWVGLAVLIVIFGATLLTGRFSTGLSQIRGNWLNKDDIIKYANELIKRNDTKLMEDLSKLKTNNFFFPLIIKNFDSFGLLVNKSTKSGTQIHYEVVLKNANTNILTLKDIIDTNKQPTLGGKRKSAAALKQVAGTTPSSGTGTQLQPLQSQPSSGIQPGTAALPLQPSASPLQQPSASPSTLGTSSPSTLGTSSPSASGTSSSEIYYNYNVNIWSEIYKINIHSNYTRTYIALSNFIISFIKCNVNTVECTKWKDYKTWNTDAHANFIKTVNDNDNTNTYKITIEEKTVSTYTENTTDASANTIWSQQNLTNITNTETIIDQININTGTLKTNIDKLKGEVETMNTLNNNYYTNTVSIKTNDTDMNTIHTEIIKNINDIYSKSIEIKNFAKSVEDFIVKNGIQQYAELQTKYEAALNLDNENVQELINNNDYVIKNTQSSEERNKCTEKNNELNVEKSSVVDINNNVTEIVKVNNFSLLTNYDDLDKNKPIIEIYEKIKDTASSILTVINTAHDILNPTLYKIENVNYDTTGQLRWVKANEQSYTKPIVEFLTVASIPTLIWTLVVQLGMIIGGITLSWIGLLFISLITALIYAFESARVFLLEKVSIDGIIQDAANRYIYQLICEKQYLYIDANNGNYFDLKNKNTTIPLPDIIIINIAKIFNNVFTFNKILYIDRYISLVSSENINDDTCVGINTVEKNDDNNNKLINLNIPTYAFISATKTVQTTYNKETTDLLIKYATNKDKFLEDHKNKILNRK